MQSFSRTRSGQRCLRGRHVAAATIAFVGGLAVSTPEQKAHLKAWLRQE